MEYEPIKKHEGKYSCMGEGVRLYSSREVRVALNYPPPSTYNTHAGKDYSIA